MWRCCLQCTKLHTLDEFSGDRRSCQASLLARRQRSKQVREAGVVDEDWSRSEGGAQKRQRRAQSVPKPRRQPVAGKKMAVQDEEVEGPALSPCRSASSPHTAASMPTSSAPAPRVLVMYLPAHAAAALHSWPAQPVVAQAAQMTLAAPVATSLPHEEAVVLQVRPTPEALGAGLGFHHPVLGMLSCSPFRQLDS